MGTAAIQNRTLYNQTRGIIDQNFGNARGVLYGRGQRASDAVITWFGQSYKEAEDNALHEARHMTSANDFLGAMGAISDSKYQAHYRSEYEQAKAYWDNVEKQEYINAKGAVAATDSSAKADDVSKKKRRGYTSAQGKKGLYVSGGGSNANTSTGVNI